MNKFVDFVALLGGRATERPAIGLGQLWLRSSFGQALLVDIPLLNAVGNKLAALRVASYCTLSDMGDPDPTVRSGDPVPLTSTLRHESGGQYFIRLISKRALLKDNLYLRVTLDDDGQRVQREYRHRLRGSPTPRRDPPIISAPSLSKAAPALPVAAASSIKLNGTAGAIATNLGLGSDEDAYATYEWLEKEIAQLQHALDHLRQAACRQKQTLADQAEKATLHRTLVRRIDAQTREMALLMEKLQPAMRGSRT
ncbi:hypothetical protein [Dyella japonica]|uniref:FimV N-terminal domain-containing protein n=1 Tax=Dyella japonica TaxID=231455 RepID=A0ABV2K171_9GAMM